MNEVVQIQFADKMLSFDTFLSAIRNVVKEEVCKAVGKRPFLTQAKAYDIYGRKNVERWKREGKVKDFARGSNGKASITTTGKPNATATAPTSTPGKTGHAFKTIGLLCRLCVSITEIPCD